MTAPAARRPTTRGIRAQVVVAVLAGVSFALAAQELTDPPTFGERISVEVVNIDVVVTAKDGSPVTDLGKDDFILLIDGRPTSFEYFAGPESLLRLAQPGVKPVPVTVEEPPLELLVAFVDQTALDERQRRSAIGELRQTLARGYAARAMVASFDERLQVWATPTDPARAQAALDELARSPLPKSMASKAERNRIELDLRWLGNRSGNPFIDPPGQSYQSGLAPADRQRLGHEIRDFAKTEAARQQRTLRSLRNLLAALGVLPGRKAVVLASGGFVGNPADGLVELYRRVGDAVIAGDLRGEMAELSAATELAFEQTVDAAQEARATLYAVTPQTPPDERLGPQFRSAGEATTVHAALPQDAASIDRPASLHRLAGTTGGKVMMLRDDIEQRLVVVATDADSSYRLGFSSGPLDTRAHDVEVRTRRKDLSLRYRSQYRRRTAEEQAEQALLAAATFDVEDNPFAVVIETLPAPAGGDKGVAAFAVRIPIGALTLIPDGDARQGQVVVRVAARDERGDVLVGSPAHHTIRVPEAELAMALERTWVYRAQLRLEPGKHRLAVVVTDEGSGRYSSERKDIEIPAAR